MINGKTKIEFGFGDILITPMVKEDFSSGCIVLQNQEPHKIGEYTPSDDFTAKNDDSVISFANTESIDVLIERLQKLKEMMNKNIEGCSAPIEYDY